MIILNNILIVEDEAPIRNLIKRTMTDAGYACTEAADGQQAADLIEETDYDLVLLDIMLPGVDGFELVEYIAPLGVPVIFLTAKDDVVDKVRGLRLGADDYMVKPFEPAELVARVEAVLRRYGKGTAVLSRGDVTLDIAERVIAQGGRTVDFTAKETDLFVLLMQNPGKTLYREYLYEQVWGPEFDIDTRTLDTHIQRIRRKLGWDETIKTIYGVGYRLEREP